METAPLSSPTTSIDTTAQAHVEVDEDRPTTSMDGARAVVSKDFKDHVNGIWSGFHQLQAWNVALEAEVKKLWRYGIDVHARYTTAQRQLAQAMDTIAARDKRLVEAEEKLLDANAAIKSLTRDCAIYSEGADALSETLDSKVNEIQRLTNHTEGLETKVAQMEEQHQALRNDLSEAQSLLQALEAPAEPSGRAMRKKRKQ